MAAVLWVALIAAPHLSGRASVLDDLDARLLDLRLRSFGAIAPSGDVVLVAIDDDAMAARSGSGSPRVWLAGIVAAIADARPGALAVDVLFADPGPPEADIALAGALARVPAVIAAAGRFEDGPARPGLPQARDTLWPQPGIAGAARVGMVNVVTDRSGTPRHLPLLVLTERGLQPSLALQAVSLFEQVPPRFDETTLRLGARELPLDLGLHLPLRLVGPAGTIPTIPAAEIADASQRLKGKLVVLGFTASALGDRFATPFDASLPGAELLAGAMSQLLGAGPLRRDAQVRRWDAALAGTVAALCTGAVILMPLSTGLPLALALVLAALGAVWLAFAQGLWLNAALLLAGAGPPLLLAGIGRYAVERRAAARAGRAVQTLKRFQSPVLAELIAGDPGFLRQPETRDLVVLFVDLAGFTRLSQALGPEGTETFLKGFHHLVTDAVHGQGGAVLNFMGDGALAVFGLTGTGGDSAAGALAAGFALIDSAPHLGRAQGLAEPPGLRVGIHAGPVILSRLGDETQQQISVSGDTVNLASRLMEIAKAEGAILAASAPVAEAGRTAGLRAPDALRTLPVRGRAGEVDVALWRL